MKLLGNLMYLKRKISGKHFSEEDIAVLKAKAQTNQDACELLEDAAQKLTALSGHLRDKDSRAVVDIYYAALKHVIKCVKQGM